MNSKALNEIRRRFTVDNTNLTCIRGCYVSEKREIISMFKLPPVSLPPEEGDRYLSLFKKALSGTPDKNLVEIPFANEAVGVSDEHKLLTALRDTAITDDDMAEVFFQRVLAGLPQEGSFLILLAHDAYDVPFRNHNGERNNEMSDEVFKYINDRNKLLEEMQDLSDQMVKLLEAKQALGTVTATSEGYIVALDLKAGDSYDGQKSAYTIAKKEDVPVLRADVTDLKKDVSEGARVEMAGDYDTFRSEVTAVVDDTDGRKYAEIELTEDFLRTAGGMQKLLQDGSLQVSIVFRARKNATIIPASALRSEGEGEYVFVAERVYGGFLNSGGLKAKKTSVTVSDRSDTAVSVQEDLSYQSIIDRADRTVEDGKPVMEYVE